MPSRELRARLLSAEQRDAATPAGYNRVRAAGEGLTSDQIHDFLGHVLSVFFRDPDGLELVPGRINPPGTPAARYHPS